jgi:hypothetical protein
MVLQQKIQLIFDLLQDGKFKTAIDSLDALKQEQTPVLVVYDRFGDTTPRGRSVSSFKFTLVRMSRTTNALATAAARISTSVMKRVILLTIDFFELYPIAFKREKSVDKYPKQFV